MCGIVGFYNVGGLKAHLTDGLKSMQTRGKNGAGFYATDIDGSNPFWLRENGYVSSLCGTEAYRDWDDHSARIAIGQVRFGTSGSYDASCNVQPFVRDTPRWGRIADAHNGDTLNAAALRKELEEAGETFESNSDSELFLARLSREQALTPIWAIENVMRNTRGTFSLLFCGPGWLVAARDPWGNRPLAMGDLGSGWAFASETVTLEILRARHIRELAPGEMAVCQHGKLSFVHYPFYGSPKPANLHQCSFEHVYFSRPSSTVFGRSVADYRLETGIVMASFLPPPAEDEIVVPIKDSGEWYAVGLAEARGSRYRPALERAHDAVRSYIMSDEEERDDHLRTKLNPVRKVLAGKTVVLVDDTVVRATTSRKIIRMVRGNESIPDHLRPKRVILVICAPPVTGACHYGVRIDDIKARLERIRELGSVEAVIEEVRQYIEADELYFMPQHAFENLFGKDRQDTCFACFNGVYPSLIKFPTKKESC